jgi:hypothetical protein
VKIIFLLFIMSATCFQSAAAKGRALLHSPAKVPQKTARLTGTYHNRWSEFKIQALGVNRLHVQFNGSYQYRAGGQMTANTGTADGMATVKYNVATFTPTDTQGCSITLTFAGQKLIAKQTGSDADCGFGHNVTADGTYIKRSNRPPKFETQ